MNGSAARHSGHQAAFSAFYMADPGDFAPRRLAFTIAPHLQIINYRNRFSRFPGI
jgi:hypothetical protein